MKNQLHPNDQIVIQWFKWFNFSSCAPKKPMGKLIEPHRRPLAGNRPNGHFSRGKIDFFMGKSWFLMGKSQWWWFTAEMGIHISNPCWSVHGNITTLAPLGKVISNVIPVGCREMGGLPCLPCRAGGSTISVLYLGVVCTVVLWHFSTPWQTLHVSSQDAAR